MATKLALAAAALLCRTAPSQAAEPASITGCGSGYRIAGIDGVNTKLYAFGLPAR